MILSVFITVISGHDKPQPPGCLLGNRTILYIHARECTEVGQMVIGRSEHFVQPLRSVSYLAWM
ncbi:hypothetical protein DUZ51_24060 [Escherichia coli]|nr:hypothetical protein [Salmonella enterica subsp. enterica serovar Derby]EFO1842336.1 hypothetical protein [Escherichia coli]